jgi:PAS domain S-box-containing protein
VEVSAKILADGRWQAFVRDVTDRKRREDERRVFVSLLENSSDFIGIADPDGTPIYVNPAGRRMVGLPPDLPLEQTQIPDYYPPEERRFATEVILKSMIERDRWSGETFFRHWQTGQAIPVSDEHFMIRNPTDGRIIGIGTVTRDISEARRAREQLQLSEARLSGIAKRQRFLSEMGAVLASSLDYEQTLVNVGQLMVRDLADWCVIDLVEQETRVRRLKVVSADSSKAALALQLEQPLDRSRDHLTKPALESKRPFVVERVTPRDVESFAQSPEHLALLRAIEPKSIMGLPLVGRGELLGALVLISCTPSRLYRDDDVHFGEALAERAALAIDNGRLYEAAVHATRLRDEMLGVVAHDLRNPLSVIVIESAALRRRGSEPERRSQESVQAIRRAASRMNRLIRDLLDITLIESGQLGLQTERLSTRELILELVEAQRPLAAASALDVRLDLKDELPDIRGDRHRLLQVLENLIGNAVKFTPAGGQITIGATAHGREAVFRVTDTGFGIAPSAVSHVFDRFWQARKGAREDGAGLGLPIARGIVEAHGGRIWVESILGSGTSFFFTIPTVEDKPKRETGDNRVRARMAG